MAMPAEAINQENTLKLKRLFMNREWRLSNLYWIQNEQGERVKFVMNGVQRYLDNYLWWLNLILKSRQHGITTWALIQALDIALFTPGSRCGIVAHTREDAEKFFRHKIIYALDRLPDWVHDIAPIVRRDMNGSLEFGNGSSIEVSVSHRGGTFQFLHISEYGPMCAMFPERANEVKAGALNTVHKGGIVTIESTAKGREGDFFDRCRRAMALYQRLLSGKAKLTRMDYRFFFFAWFDDPKNWMDTPVYINEEHEKYFDHLEKVNGIKLMDPQKYWYIKKEEDQGEKMKQEHPSCLTGEALISTERGIIPIREAVSGVHSESGLILAAGPQPVSKIFRLETVAGRVLRGTYDHPIHVPSDDFVYLSRLKPGDKITLRPPMFSREPHTFAWESTGRMNHSVLIDESWGKFIGYFMGDGSWHKDVLSIVCDPQDEDVINDVRSVLGVLFGEFQQRHIGKIKGRRGTVELRKGVSTVKELFSRLGLIGKSSADASYRREVHVPDCIFRSPRGVIRQFLRALFESDGSSMTGRQAGTVRLGTCKVNFAREIQLLLLGFGINSTIRSNNKKAGNGSYYESYLLELPMASSIKFHNDIGFIGARKSSRQPRTNEQMKCLHQRRSIILMEDVVKEVVDEGVEDITYDLTVEGKHVFSANGILTHNTPEEAFEASNEACYYAQQMAIMRKQGRICRVPIIPSEPVNTFWDLGRNDSNAIWLHQHIGLEHRFIAYYQNSGKDISHYAKWLIDFKVKHEIVYGRHYLPHDGNVVELTRSDNKTREEVLNDLGIKPTIIVDKIENLQNGIDMVRQVFPGCWIDEDRCQGGIEALDKYQKRWNNQVQAYQDDPLKNDARNGADAFRQFAQGYFADKSPPKKRAKRRPGSWKTR